MKSILRGLAIVVAVFAGTLVMSTPPAHATAQHYFEGISWWKSGYHTNCGGARAYVRRYCPRVGTGASDVSSAWVMIDQQASNALAQIGWVRYPYYFGTNVCYFWEYEEPYAIVSNGPIFISVVPSPALGGADQFGVTNYTTDGAMHFYLNGVIKHMLTPDWAPDDAEFNGEVVRDSADTMPQMPGDTSYQCYYADTDSSINVYYTDTRAWIKVHPNSGNWYWGVGSGYSGHSVNSDDTWMRIWDTRYSTEGSE